MPAYLFQDGEMCPGVGPRNTFVFFSCGEKMEVVAVREVDWANLLGVVFWYLGWGLVLVFSF